MKTHNLYYLCIGLVSAFITSCSIDSIRASEDIITEERVVANFTEVDVSNDIEFIIKQGSEQSVKVTTSNNVQNSITTRVSNGKLIVRLSGNIRKLKTLRLNITMPTISKLDISADSFGTLSGFENLEAFRLSASSDASVTLSGSANSVNINASSDAKIEGFDFDTKTCNVTCSSDAFVSITCTESLSGSVSSDGVVFYKGNPAVDVSINSDGSIINSN